MKRIDFLLFSFCFVFSSANAQVVSTFVGSTEGFINATGTAAQFNRPNGICKSTSGNFYVADLLNNQIRKITPQGVVTTLAGTTEGYSDGLGTTAQFDHPYGVCADPSGNVYVADTYNTKIRKITPSGFVSTFAGSTQGFANGTGTTAKFYSPTGICIDPSGNIFVVDAGNNKIRKITPTGIVSTFAGSTAGYTNGTGTAAKFSFPFGICSDNGGNLYVADANNSKIRKITPTGNVTTLAGSDQGFNDGNGNAAQFKDPYGVCTDSAGNVYVADTSNNRIRKITPAGIVTTLAGCNDQGYLDGITTVAQFFLPTGVCSDAQGNIYVADNYNDKIRKISPTLGLDLNISNFTLTILPNPASYFLNIEINNFYTNTKISITDMFGKNVYSQNLETYKTIINTSGYAKGLYLVTLTNGTKKLTQKVIID